MTPQSSAWIGRALRVGWAPAAVVLLHGAYATLIGHPPELDLLMHPLGGLAIAYAAHTAIPMLEQALGRLTVNSHSLLVLGVSFIAANVWEYVEFAADLLLDWEIQSSVPETMIDLLLGTGAATVFVAVSHVRRLKSERTPSR